MLKLVLAMIHKNVIAQNSFFALIISLSTPVSVQARSFTISAPVSSTPSYSYDQSIKYVAQFSGRSEYNQAVKLFKSGRFTEAIAAFGRIISNTGISPKLKNKALVGRSQAFLVINQPRLAIIDLKKISYESDQKELIGEKEMILGVAFIQIKQYPLAVKHLTQAIINLPGNGFAYANRSVAYQALQNYDSAVRDIEKALKFNPTPSSVFNLAVLEKERKNYSRCYYLLTQLKNQKAAYADVYLQRGLCAKALNKHELALEDFLRASSIDKSKAEAIENVGLMLAFMGNNKSALKYLEAASTLYLEEGNIESYEAVANHILRINSN